MTRTVSSSWRSYYGQLWQYGLDTEVLISAVGAYFPISGMSDGNDKGFIFQNAQQLLCTKRGLYVGVWAICFNNSNNIEWTGGISVNDTIQQNTIGCRKLGANDTGAMSSNGLVVIEKGDVVELAVANNTNLSSLFVDSANLTLFRIGR